MLLCRNQAATPRRHWWQLMRKQTSITPRPRGIGQILWTDPSSSTAHHGKTSYDSHLPGTSSTLSDVMQVWPPKPLVTFDMCTQLLHVESSDFTFHLSQPTRSKLLLALLTVLTATVTDVQ